MPKDASPEIGGIRLIDVSIATADDRPVADVASLGFRGPKAGFWYRALRFADEKESDPDRFAACCFPDRYGPGIRGTYIVSHENVIYKKDLGHGRGIEVYPRDPVKEGWERLD